MVCSARDPQHAMSNHSLGIFVKKDNRVEIVKSGEEATDAGYFGGIESSIQEPTCRASGTAEAIS